MTAPVDGMVQQLAVHTVGGVVTPAQTLLYVVPAESRLEIEAMISNRDIGFVSAGQQAAVKVDTFNFTRYGLLHGTILSILAGCHRPRQASTSGGDKTSGAANDSSEPRGQELLYSARISLDRTQLAIEGKQVNLSAGMAVTAEIKTGRRRIISYLLSPLARYQHDTLAGAVNGQPERGCGWQPRSGRSRDADKGGRPLPAAHPCAGLRKTSASDCHRDYRP